MSMYNAGKIYKVLFPIFFTSAFLPIVGTADRRKSSRKIVKSAIAESGPLRGPVNKEEVVFFKYINIVMILVFEYQHKMRQHKYIQRPKNIFVDLGI